MNFSTIIKSVNKINNIIKNMKNGEIDSKYIDNIYNGLEEGTFNLSSLFSKLNKKIEKIEDEVKKNSKEIEKLKIDNEILKNDKEAIEAVNKNICIRVEALEKGLKNIGIEFECPITNKIIESPVITPYGFTYKEKEIKKWINKNGSDSMNLQPLAEDKLIKNYGLKNVIEQ